MINICPYILFVLFEALENLKRAYYFVNYRPDDDNDTIKDVIGVPKVLKEAESSQL